MRTRRCAHVRPASTPTRGCARTSRRDARLRTSTRRASSRSASTAVRAYGPGAVVVPRASHRRSVPPGQAAMRFPSAALRALGLGSATLTECGAHALLVAARRGSHAAPAASGRAADRRAAGARAGACRDERARRRGGALRHAHAGRGLERGRALAGRALPGRPADLRSSVPGTRRRLDAHSSGVADDAALAAIADLVAIALGRTDASQVLPAA